MDKSIAFIFIGTNKYIEFFQSYHSSVMGNFIPEVSKEIIAFTDEPAHPEFDKENVTSFYIEHEPWPYITLKRFEFMMKAEDHLKKFSDIIFMDADMEVVAPIPAEFLELYQYYFGVQHPGQFMYGPVCEFETNPESTACVTKHVNETRFRQGCFWGGKNPHILDMIRSLRDNVNTDLEKDIIAAWHDESHVNRFFSDNEEKVLTLSPGFAYPEMWNMPTPKVIVHKDKNMEEFPRFRGAKQENDSG